MTAPVGAIGLTYDATAVPASPVGAGHYTLQLASALGERDDVDLTVLSRRDDGARWRQLVPSARVAATAPASRPLRLAWEQARLPARLRRIAPDVHHGPHYTLPERTRVPVVVTIHDLSFFEEPEWHERSKVRFFQRAIRVAARRARVVVCPSAVTEQELHRWCSVDAQVVVAHHGVDTRRFRPDAGGADGETLRMIDPRLVADGVPLVLFVGTIEPRKDVPTLVRAFDKVADRHPDALLMLAGSDGWGVTATDRAVAAAGARGRVVRPGYVPDDAVPALLRRATVAAYPARYEGFGLPALEALACGTPLVTTLGTAMHEVAGDAAVLVPPGDDAALADALDHALGAGSAADGRRLLDAGGERRRARGFEIVAAHTWASSAVRHVDAYRLAMA